MQPNDQEDSCVLCVTKTQLAMYHERKCYVLNIITAKKRSQAGDRPSVEDNHGKHNGSTNSTYHYWCDAIMARGNTCFYKLYFGLLDRNIKRNYELCLFMY